MTDNVKYLDLDAVDPNETEFVVKLAGAEHKLQPITVEGFIANAKLAETLGLEPTLDQEVDAIADMLIRAFPTMKKAELLKLPMSHLNKILAFAKAHNGSDAMEEEMSEANPPVAGQ